jgi:hypothetical protein
MVFRLFPVLKQFLEGHLFKTDDESLLVVAQWRVVHIENSVNIHGT